MTRKARVGEEEEEEEEEEEGEEKGQRKKKMMMMMRRLEALQHVLVGEGTHRPPDRRVQPDRRVIATNQIGVS